MGRLFKTAASCSGKTRWQTSRTISSTSAERGCVTRPPLIGGAAAAGLSVAAASPGPSLVDSDGPFPDCWLPSGSSLPLLVLLVPFFPFFPLLLLLPFVMPPTSSVGRPVSSSLLLFVPFFPFLPTLPLLPPLVMKPSSSGCESAMETTAAGARCSNLSHWLQMLFAIELIFPPRP